MILEGFSNLSNNSVTLHWVISAPHWVHFPSAPSARPPRAGRCFRCAHVPVTSAQGVFVYSLRWVHVPSAHSACPLGTGQCPLGTEAPVTCAQGAGLLCTQRILLCTERTSSLHGALVPPAHGVCQRRIHQPPGIHTQPEEVELDAWATAGLLVWGYIQHPPALAPLGAQRGRTVTSNHLGKLSWAGLFFAGLDKAHQPLGPNKCSPPHTPPHTHTPHFTELSELSTGREHLLLHRKIPLLFYFILFLIENTPEGTRKPPPTSLRAATGKGRHWVRP